MQNNLYEVARIHNPKPICVQVPGSKSITNRALLLAALADGRTQLDNVLFSDDSRHFLQALIDLGFHVSIDEENAKVTIDGCAGNIPAVLHGQKLKIRDREVNASIYVGSAGTAARFLTAFLGLSSGTFFVDASEQMKKRPMKELMLALTSLGAEIEYLEEEYHFPFIIGNRKIACTEVTIDIDKSSQFLSALLISSVLWKDDLTIRITGTHGMAYVKMTMDMMEQFGVIVQNQNDSYLVKKDASYKSRDYLIEPDLSGACYFYALSPLLGVTSMVKYIHMDSMQGDVAFIHVLERLGCRYEDLKEGVIVYPPSGQMTGGSFDLSTFSDQALTLSAIAPFCSNPVTITGISHIRHQECDRIHAMEVNLKALGCDMEIKQDVVTIYPSRLKGNTIQTFDDHRVAMSFALCGTVLDHVLIENPSCCRKTFENFFDLLETL